MVVAVLGDGCARRAPKEAEVEKLPIAIGAARPLGEARTPGVLVVPATGEARDVAVAAGSAWVVATGALVEYPTGGAPRALGWSEGLGTTSPTAIAAAGDVVVVGGADGSLTVVENGRSRIVRVAGGPIVDLAADGHTVYAATHGGLLVWKLGAAMATRLLAGADVTAIALGPSGLAVGLGDGGVAIVENGAPRTIAPPGDDAVTAIAWNGDGLWVGRPAGLERWDGGRRARVRADVHVTALLPDGHTLLVGTPDAGVLALDEGGGERRLLGDARIARLRRLDGQPVAIADAEVYGLADGAPYVGPAPPGLAVAAVTSVALLGDEVWVGGERGVDVLDARGAFLRHVATRAAVLALTPRTGEMLVATTDGALVVGARGARRVGEREGLLGSRVAAAAALAGWTGYATDLGATLIDERGVAVRLASGAELPAGGASALAWGPDGKLYVGTAGGLAAVTVAGRPHAEPALALGAVGALAVGTAGLYVAGANGVVLVREGGTSSPLGGPRAAVLAVEPGGPGERVFAGSAVGLDVLEESWRSVRGPLPPAAVTALAPTEDALWIGTDQGLVRMSRAVLETALAPPRS